MAVTEQLLAPIAQSSLSEFTKRNYKTKVQQLERITQHKLCWILQHPDEALSILRETVSSEATTHRTFFAIVLGIFKYNPELREKQRKAYEQWLAAFKTVDVKVQDKYDTMTASQKQTEAYVPWTTIVTKREAYPDKRSQDYLVLCCYTMIPPVRADLGDIKICQHEKEIVSRYPNYLMMMSPTDMTLVLTAFKTDRAMKIYRQILPPELCKVIDESLQKNPRKFLIVSPRTGSAFENPGTFSNYVGRVLKRILGTPHASLNMLRHSYVTSLDLNKMTSRDMKNAADSLMHSVETMMRYRLRVPTEDKNMTCEVTCSQK